MLPTRTTRVAIVTLAVLAAACGDPTKPKATYANALSTYVLTALTGAPATASTAVNFLGGATRADAGFAFDIAVDLDASGRPVIYPVRSLASGLAGSVKRIGLQVVPGPFDAVREAPKTGYDTLKAQTIRPGDVLAVEMLDLNTCLYSFGGQLLYAKFTVDSVPAGTRKVYARSVVDPNCGYRSVVPDSIPRF